MTNDAAEPDPVGKRPARPDEVEPSDDMRRADVANGEPGASTDDPPDPGSPGSAGSGDERPG